MCECLSPAGGDAKVGEGQSDTPAIVLPSTVSEAHVALEVG